MYKNSVTNNSAYVFCNTSDGRVRYNIRSIWQKHVSDLTAKGAKKDVCGQMKETAKC